MRRNHRIRTVARTVAIWSFSCLLDAAEEQPRVFLLDGKHLAEGRRLAIANDPRVHTSLGQLRRDARQALTVGPFSVMAKSLTPPSGDKHDYFSFGPYWWPDPQRPDGLPYIRRDGEVNPQSTGAASDSDAWDEMTSAAETLALGYYFTGDETYAEQASKLLRAWFLDPETRMNPHLKYGQAIPGRVEGRGIGIIDTRRIGNLVDAMGLLASSAHWPPSRQSEMTRWMDQYLEWLLTSKHGTDEDREANNHGTWYDVQVTVLALAVDKRDTARRVAEAASAKRIISQIEPDGKQPRELARTRSFDYSVMNLEGMFALATLARHVGVDHGKAGTDTEARLRAALDYLVRHSDPARKWPHQQIRPVARTRLRPLLRAAAVFWNDPRYDEIMERTKDGTSAEERMHLLWPR